MAPLRSIVDIKVVALRDLLNEGKHRRDEVKAKVLEALADGVASPPMQKLAAELFGAKRGRQATGLYRWMEIGAAADQLSEDGVGRAEILATLADQYGRSEKHVDACITQWGKARAGR